METYLFFIILLCLFIFGAVQRRKKGLGIFSPSLHENVQQNKDRIIFLGIKRKANSPFFSVVVGAIYIICIIQFLGVIAIGGMIEQYNSPPILGYIAIPAIICGVIVLIGLHALIDVVKGLETKMDILHQEKNK
jgi:hypothetical protein|tara:strand:- start:168 stop:569 length:402 start_codon:yes stop_codon:yes gene_type:complete